MRRFDGDFWPYGIYSRKRCSYVVWQTDSSAGRIHFLSAWRILNHQKLAVRPPSSPLCRTKVYEDLASSCNICSAGDICDWPCSFNPVSKRIFWKRRVPSIFEEFSSVYHIFYTWGIYNKPISECSKWIVMDAAS